VLNCFDADDDDKYFCGFRYFKEILHIAGKA